MITYPSGFRCGSTACGLKPSGKPDLALVVNDGSGVAAGVFTTNRVQAAPVRFTRELVSAGQLDAVVINSGNANACTGEAGLADAREMSELASAALGIDRVGVCSTGIIGVPLDMTALREGIPAAAAAVGEEWEGGAQAILTTDTRAKTSSASGTGYRIGAMAKGAGMIAPGMATMIAIITTDADLSAAGAREALTHANRLSFNRIDSDGCMSTNDTVLLLASGASGVAPEPAELTELLTEVCADLARQIIADGEGASHDVRIRVTGARDEAGAVEVGRAISRSNLVSCAIAGGDPNWGRILSAAGTVPEEVAPFDEADVSIAINGVTVCAGGIDAGERADVDMSAREVHIDIDLGAGEAEGIIWTNDLTHGYVTINGEYTT